MARTTLQADERYYFEAAILEVRAWALARLDAVALDTLDADQPLTMLAALDRAERLMDEPAPARRHHARWRQAWDALGVAEEIMRSLETRDLANQVGRPGSDSGTGRADGRPSREAAGRPGDEQRRPEEGAGNAGPGMEGHPGRPDREAAGAVARERPSPGTCRPGRAGEEHGAPARGGDDPKGPGRPVPPRLAPPSECCPGR